MQAATAVIAPRSPRMVAWSRMGDESLASRAAAGNGAAFAALYERYHAPLLGYCRSILLDTEDARDATQSALENALRALPRREPGRPLRPWLYRIAHNEAINIVRRRQTAAEADVDPATVLTVPGPEVDSEQRTRLAQLVDDLRMLPERQRGALVMRELSGLSYDEIGLALGVSNEAARRAVFDARSALHDAVDGRATECGSVRRTLSDGDRRHLRARGVRAHLRSCDDCADFERAMGARQLDLHALGPWLGGAGALSLIGLGGLGAGGAGGVLVAAGGGGSATVIGGGGLGWAGLPAAVKGLAVAAIVATTGTAAVEIPKVVKQDARAPQTQATTPAVAPAPAAISPPHDAQRAQVAAARRARAARRYRAAGVRSGGGGATSVAIGRGASQAAPAALAPPAATAIVTPRPAAPAAPPATARQPAPAVAATPQQLAIESLQRVREQILAAFQNVQTIAAPGTPSALQTANAMIQSTLGSVRTTIERILATVGLRLPTGATTTTPPPPPPTAPNSPTITNVLAPAQSLLGGVNGLLQTLFGHR